MSGIGEWYFLDLMQVFEVTTAVSRNDVIYMKRDS